VCERLAPAAPRVGDEIELRVGELRDRAHVRRAVDDDLLVLDGREEVRDDAHLPVGRVLREPEHFRRGLVLVAGAERAGVELLPRLSVLAGLELGAGVYVNSLPPEEAAARLREARSG